MAGDLGFGSESAPAAVKVLLTYPRRDSHMAAMTYFVKAHWDEEAGVYYSETNIPGLTVEAETLPEFIEIAEELAPQMLEANVPGWSSETPKARPTAELELAIA